MTVGNRHLGQAATRTVFLDALAKYGNATYAARVAGVSRNAVNWHRRAHPDFDAAVVAALPAGGEPRTIRKWDAGLQRQFLDAFRVSGNVAAAATACGASQAAAYDLRNRCATFATAWWDAKREAAERVEGMLFDVALNGSTETLTDGEGRTTTVHRQRPDVMLRLLARRDLLPRSQNRIVELTPELLETARAKLARHLRIAFANGQAHAAWDGTGPEPTATYTGN